MIDKPIVSDDEYKLANKVGMTWREFACREQNQSFVDRQLKWLTKLCEDARTVEDGDSVTYSSSVNFELPDGRRLRVTVGVELFDFKDGAE